MYMNCACTNSLWLLESLKVQAKQALSTHLLRLLPLHLVAYLVYVLTSILPHGPHKLVEFSSGPVRKSRLK